MSGAKKVLLALRRQILLNYSAQIINVPLADWLFDICSYATSLIVASMWRNSPVQVDWILQYA